MHTKLEKMLVCCVENIMLSLGRKQCISLLMWKKKHVWSIRHLCQQKWKVLISQRCLFSLMSTTALQNYPRVLYMFYLFFGPFPFFKHGIINFMGKGKTLFPWIVLLKKSHVIVNNTLHMLENCSDGLKISIDVCNCAIISNKEKIALFFYLFKMQYLVL